MLLQDSQSSWNKNIFKWASGLIGGNHHTKKSDDTVLVVNYFLFSSPPTYFT